jgi:transcriptional regulator with XRE-family HTH domain
MRHITQTELARLLDVSQSRVSRIENGGHPLQLDTLREFIESLGGRLEVTAIFDDERFPIDLEQAG